MLASLPLLSALFAATPSPSAPSAPPDCEAAPLSIELQAEPGAPLAALCISPELATTLLFDTPLPPGAVAVQATEQEVQVAQGRELVTLLPSARMAPGEWSKLTVRFGDGAGPANATLLLYVHPGRAARQVEVRRQVRTVGSYLRELEQRREEVRKCEEENAQLRSAQARPEGLRGLLSAGLMGKGGVAFVDLTEPRRFTVRKGSALEAQKVVSYRARNRVAVELKLELLVRGQPWVAEGARLVDAQGGEVRLLPLWQEATPGEDWQHVIVEAEAKSHEAHGPYTLKLWEAGGKRGITLEGVVFPPLEAVPAR